MPLTIGVGTPAPEPGIYEDIPNADYHAWDACNASRLKLYEAFSHNAVRLRHELLNPAPPTAALIAGTAFHAYCESPELFRQRAIRGPACNRATKAGKAAWASWIDQLTGPIGDQFRELLASDARVDAYPAAAAKLGYAMLMGPEYDAIVEMGESAGEHPIVRKLWETPAYSDETRAGRQIEVSIVWIDSDTEVLCKGRIDCLVRYVAADLPCCSVWDYKTVVGDQRTNAGQASFRWEIRNRRYLLSADHYNAGLAANGITVDATRFVAIDKAAPHCVGVHQVDERDLLEAGIERRAVIHDYAELCRSRRFRGYVDADGNDIMRMRVPPKSTGPEYDDDEDAEDTH